ncbi:hypothetical protein [Prevotella brunnea]|uniref:hypothetical protein n=1 Tax=Prevotella brunnea TaxID=2508867 RepID=UPI001F02E1E0|nr:hypothetical protein [Prevotella brunnea]
MEWKARVCFKELVCDSFVPPERIQQLWQYDRRICDLDDENVHKPGKLTNDMGSHEIRCEQ